MDSHIPVMLSEVLEYLQVSTGQKYIDATVGGGGYTEAILIRGGEVLGIDQDPKSLELARKHLTACPGVFKLAQGNFSKLQEIAQNQGFAKVSGIVFDLGFASFQIDDPTRGLSFQKEGPLDMRLDPNLGVTAADLVNTLSEKQLETLFREFGEEPAARRIAQEIVKEREQEKIKTTRQLSELIENIQSMNKSKIHPATKVFQALRIAVNTELENLKTALPQALSLLNPKGRLVVVSFHSGEDRIVKNFFRDQEEAGLLSVLTQKPVVPSIAEVQNNPRARSAKMRVGQKI